MRRYTLLTALILISLTNALQAQPDTLWTKSIGGALTDVFYSVEPITGGGYIVGGYTESNADTLRNYWLGRLNSAGDDTIWTRADAAGGTEGRMAIATSDGGAIIVGTGNPRIIKTDGDGILLWQKDESEIPGGLFWIEETADNGLIASGVYQPNGVGSAYIVRMNSSGMVLWDTTYGGTNDSYGLSITELANGEFAMAGAFRSKSEPTANDAWVLKLSANGDSLGSVFYGDTAAVNSERFSVVRKTSDGGLILLGEQILGGVSDDIMLVKADANGDSSWEEIFSVDDALKGQDVIQTSDGGFAVVGYGDLTSQGGFDMIIIHTDASGTTDWTKQISPPYGAAGTAMTEISTGEYLAVGVVNPAADTPMDGWIVRLGPAEPDPFEQDSLALVALYNSTNGAGWTDDTNWLTGTVDTWYGVTVTEGRVTQLDLDNNDLAGPLPTEIGNLTGLTRLYFYNNQLTGSIPTEVGSLASLQYLYLQNNQFSGTIPVTIGDLTNLTQLYLYGNQLTGSIPIELGDLTSLQIMQLYNNQLSGSIPIELGSLTSLTQLYLYGNQLTGSIPVELGSLTSLTDLRLGGNQLTGTIPSQIGSLTSLQYLYLYDNQLTGAVPDTLGTLSSLAKLYIYNNELEDLPDFITMDSQISDLRVYGNKLTFEDLEPNISILGSYYAPQDSVGSETDTTAYEGGSFSLTLSVGGTDNEYQWYMDSDPISGATSNTYTIDPVQFSDTGSYELHITNTTVTDLTLYSRPIVVSVIQDPFETDSLALVALYGSTDGANWTNRSGWLSPDTALADWYGVTVTDGRVTGLNLPSNNLTGPLPPEIGSLKKVTTLFLYYNNLSGEIPPEIGDMTDLMYLLLYSNQLSGSIPSAIGNLANLRDLYLNTNNLTGTIPIQLASLSMLSKLHLYSNELTGTIPDELSGCTSLQYLYLNDNQFTGGFPASFEGHAALNRLYINNNELTSLPDLSTCPSLSMVDASSNLLTFEDIESIVEGAPTMTFTYSPQAQVGPGLDTTLYVGESVFLSVPVGGTANEYQWLKSAEVVGTADTITIGPVTLEDAGTYQLKITNTIAGSLVLYSKAYNINVVDPFYVSDSLALVDLYNSTDGANWWVSFNWLEAEDIGIWLGVTVVDNRVTGLQLSGNMLSGPLPESIGNLTALTTLNLYGNQLTGTIPDTLCSLVNLTSLNLGQNDLSGEIPPEIGSLVNLTELDLGGNELIGTIPDAIGSLVNLTELNLGYNQLGGTIPDNISNLANLAELSLHNNQLTGTLPSTIGNLVNLTRLNAMYNNFTGAIPTEIGNLVNLVYLNLDNNALTGEIPGTIGNLVNLTDMGLSNNQLEGSVPSEITYLTNLTSLMLYVNRIVDLPDLSPMTALQYMIITNNQFTFEDLEPNMNVASEWNYYSPQDSLGEERDTTIIVGDPFALHVPVGGSANHYQWIRNWGELPGDTSDTYTVTSANLDHAGEYVLKITSSIVTDLTLYSQPINVSVVYPGSMEQDSLALVALYTSTDGPNWTPNPWDLETPVSTWPGVYVFENRVGWLYLEGNNLKGPLPQDIGNLGALTVLSINDNMITGSIPTEIGNLASLTTLTLHSDSLAGTIPQEIGNLTNLTMLEISGDLLTGSIPVEIGNLVNLTTLRLSDSELTGTVPESFSNLVNLQYLGLTHTQLSGPIPAVLGSLTSLGSLSLDGNQFSGSIPDTLTNLVNLTVLTAGYNQLSGTLPPSLGSMSNLQLLNLGYNQLSGAIPDAIGSMSSLSNLSLSGNQLTGAVPSTINNLGSLLHLHLAENRLEDLPDLTPLTSTLAYLWVQRNLLTFEDLEPNIGVPGTSFLYSPQDSVGSKVDTTVYAGDSHTITFPVGGANNVYSWTRSGSTLTEITGDTYVIDSLGIEDTGDYMVRVMNSVVGGLILDSHPYHLEVVDTSPPTMPTGVAVVTIQNDWVRLSWLPNPEPDISHYVIFMNTVAGFTPTIEDSVTESYGADTSKIVIGLTEGTTYYFRVSAVDTYGNYSPYSDEVSATAGIVGIVDGASLPEEYALHANYPNPFNPATSIRYDLPELAEVSLIVYDLLGREVVRLIDGQVEPGYHRVVWNGRTPDGREVPTGVYIARLVTQEYTRSIKMVLLK